MHGHGVLNTPSKKSRAVLILDPLILDLLLENLFIIAGDGKFTIELPYIFTHNK